MALPCPTEQREPRRGGHHSPDTQISCVRFSPLNLRAWLRNAIQTHPLTGGSITLTSSNPFDAPLINPNYLLHSFDLEAIREGARMMHKFFSGPAWQSSVVGPVTPSPDDTVAFDAAVRGATITTSHITGGAAMSRRGARGGVLEPDSRVKGVGGMRVVDVGNFRASNVSETIIFFFDRHRSPEPKKSMRRSVVSYFSVTVSAVASTESDESSLFPLLSYIFSVECPLI